ncbi:MAG: Sec-independent protein translocase protein TatB [bacterium]
MFGIGTGELLIILVIALVIIGPNKLPELARILGKGLAEFRKAADDLKDSVTREMKVEEEKRKLLEVYNSPKVIDQNSPKTIDQENTGDQAKAPDETAMLTKTQEETETQREEKGPVATDAEKPKDLL